MAGTLAAALFDRGQIRLTYQTGSLQECPSARWSASSRGGAGRDRRRADGQDPGGGGELLRSSPGQPLSGRAPAARAPSRPWAGLVIDRSSPLFDAVAVEAFVSSFSAAVIDCRDDQAYHALAAA